MAPGMVAADSGSTGEKKQEWAGQARHREHREAECWLAGLTRAHNPPIAEAGLQSPARTESGKGWLSGALSGALRGGHLKDRAEEDGQRPG